MFRRRRRDEPTVSTGEAADEPGPETPETAETPETPEFADELPVEAPERTGPWDAADAPTDDLARLDLGALRVPVSDDVEIRVEVDQSGQVVAATIVCAGSALQVSAFAASRREDIWPEVRQEIATSVKEAGGTGEEVPGPFGLELRARVPGDVPAQGLQPVRFLGVDGPRWFLRGLISGPAASDPGRAKRLEEIFRQVVVDRGGEAMAPRDALPLRLPKEAMEAMGVPPPAGLDPFQRGPEITEVQ